MKDYSAWLDSEDNFNHELKGWKNDKLFVKYADVIDLVRFDDERDISTIFEFGCGAGFVPRHLAKPYPIQYLGIDNSFNSVGEALGKEKLPTWLNFDLGDIRTYPHRKYDLACSFAVLKHFSLLEFPEILRRFLSFGKYAVFTIQFSAKDVDDGGPENDSGPYHHIWLEEKNFYKHVANAGHRITGLWTHRAEVWHGTEGREVFVITKENKK